MLKMFAGLRIRPKPVSSISGVVGVENVASELKEADKIRGVEVIKIYLWLVKLVYKQEKFLSTVYILTSVSQPLLALSLTYLYAKVIDVAVQSASVGTGMKPLFPYLFLAFVLTILSFVIDTSDSISGALARIKSNYKIRRAYYIQLAKLGVQTLEAPGLNNRISRSESIINQLTIYYENMISMLYQFIVFISSAVVLARWVPYAVPLIFLCVLPYLYFDKKYRGRIYKYEYENSEGMRRAGRSSWMLTSSVIMQEISTSRSISYLDSVYVSFYEWFYVKFLSLIKKRRLVSSISSLLLDLSVLALTIKVFSSFLVGAFSIGIVTFLIRSIGSYRSGLREIISRFNELSESGLRLRDPYILFNSKPLFEDGTEPFKPLEKGPDIKIDNITYKYPTGKKPVFKDFSLEIKSGEKIAIVGHNGAGKTTLAKLLCRIYRPQRGQILVNGVDLNTLKIDDWYDNIGILFQEYNTYGQLTVAENIHIGKALEPFDRKRAIQALKSADAYDFVMDFPHKLDQQLSENFKEGIRPSTGQWQKLAIARFFYRNSPFVIFDEPTAAIDAVSEYNIFNKIYKFFEGKTVLIVSHRFSTVRNADRIIVMEKGVIIEQGSHEELMAKRGYYFNAFSLQAEGYKEKSETSQPVVES